MKPKRYEKEAVIIKRGETVDSIYFLKSGEIFVEVIKEGGFDESGDLGNLIK